MEIGDHLMTRAEVARMCRVGPATVDSWTGQGIFTDYHTPTGQRRYLMAEVARMLRGEFPVRKPASGKDRTMGTKHPRPRFVIWLDPGTTTGVAWYDTTTEKFGSCQVATETLRGLLEERLAPYPGEHAALGYETYLALGGPRAGDPGPSNKAIGIACDVVEGHGAVLLKPMPSSARKIAAYDNRLHKLGWHKPGRGHANDAAQHLLAWILRTPPVPLRIKRALFPVPAAGGTLHP